MVTTIGSTNRFGYSGFSQLVAIMLLLAFPPAASFAAATTSHVSAPDGSNGARPVAADPASCQGVLRSEDELNLEKAVTAINNDYFSGSLDADARNQKVESIIRQTNPGGDPAKEGVIKATLAGMNEAESSQYVLSLALGKLSGKTIVDKDYSVLAGLGVPRKNADAYLGAIAAKFQPYYQKLVQVGAKFDPQNGWDLSGLKLASDQIQKDPQLNTAFMLFFSPQFAKALADPDRATVLEAGDSYILPPDANGFGGDSQRGQIQGYGKESYGDHVQELLSQFSADTQDFMQASRRASTYWNMMQGRALELFGVERGYQGKTAPEIEKDGAFAGMESAVEGLSYLGVPGELKSALYDAMEQANQIDSKNLNQGLQKLDLARKAAIAAPFIPLAMAAAPLAGGLISPAIATLASTSAGSLALMPMVFSLGGAAMQATIDKAHFGGSWLCNFSERMETAGAGALYTAPFLAAIPSLASLAAGGIGELLPLAGSTAVATTAYGALNLGTAIGFLGQMDYHGSVELADCYSTLQKAKSEAQGGNQNLANSLSDTAWNECAQGGVDLAFGLSGAGALAKDGYAALKNGGANPSEHPASPDRGWLARLLDKYSKPSSPASASPGLVKAYYDDGNGIDDTKPPLDVPEFEGKVGVVDMGSKSCKLIVVESKDGKVTYKTDNFKMTLLNDGETAISPDSYAKLQAKLKDMLAKNGIDPKDVSVFATSAMREATNGITEIAPKLENDFKGMDVTVLRGDKSGPGDKTMPTEADFALAAITGKGDAVEIGGGSVEYGGYDSNGKLQSKTVEIGNNKIFDALKKAGSGPFDANAVQTVRNEVEPFQMDGIPATPAVYLGKTGFYTDIRKVIEASPKFKGLDIFKDGLSRNVIDYYLSPEGLKELQAANAKSSDSDLYPGIVANFILQSRLMDDFHVDKFDFGNAGGMKTQLIKATIQSRRAQGAGEITS